MSLSLKRSILSLAALAIFSTALYGIKLGQAGLLDPDEPFYTLTAKEMFQRRDPMTPTIFGHPQFEKPIFFYWVLYGSYKWLGISEFTSRLGPCVAGILTVLVTYLWGLALFKRAAPALAAAIIYATAVESIGVTRIVLTDIYLCLFVTSALFCYSLGFEYPRLRKLAWHLLFVFCGLGFLTKGPLGILLPFFGILTSLCWHKDSKTFRQIPWITGLSLFALVGFPWYVRMTELHGAYFLKHFFLHENVRRFFVAEHKKNDRLLFYALVVFVGFFPWNAFLPSALWRTFREGFRGKIKSRKTFLFLAFSFLFPFVFFTSARSKLISYIFPVFPIVSLMIGAYMYRLARAIGAGARLGKGLWAMLILNLGIVPLCLVVGAGVYGAMNGVNAWHEVLVLGLLVLPMGWGSLYWLKARQCGKAFFAAAFMLLFFAAMVFGWLMPKVDFMFSTREEAKLYEKMVPEGYRGVILGSKLFVRGATYYTGNDNAAVLAEDPRGLFYTNHSIPILSTAEDLMTLPAGDYPIYCFLRPKELKLLKKILPGSRLAYTILVQNSERVFLRLERPTGA